VRTSLIPMIESSGAGLSPFTNEEPLAGAPGTNSPAAKDTDSEEGAFTFKEAELPPQGLPDGSVSLPAAPPSESKSLAKGAALRQKLRRSIVLPPPG